MEYLCVDGENACIYRNWFVCIHMPHSAMLGHSICCLMDFWLFFFSTWKITLIFVPIPPLHFLKSHKVESHLRMCRNTCNAWYGPRKSCSVSSYNVLVSVLAIWIATNCWLLTLNVAVAHGLLHIVGKVCGCFVLVKQKTVACGLHTLANVAQPVLQGTQACTI